VRGGPLAFCALLGLPSLAVAATCDLGSGPARCSIREVPTSIDQPYTVEIVAGGRRFKVEFLANQGRWHRWRVNGAAGLAYELDKESYCGTTDDLKEELCYSPRRTRF
jgi:hypothetical protein